MRIKLHTALACSSVLLLLMSGTGYGITTHDDDAEVLIKITSDTPAVSAPEKAGPKAEVRSNIDTSVSKWLEARANELNASEAHSHKGDCSHEELAFVSDVMMGGGWCDMCGCWMRHGCDPNGNCSIGHLEVCGTGYCSLHPYNPCKNSG